MKTIEYTGEYTNFNRDEILSYLMDVLDEPRLNHILNVEVEAVDLATKFSVDAEAASLVSLLHDACKQKPIEEQLRLAIQYGPNLDLENTEDVLCHSFAAATLAREYFGISDKSLLQAIAWHPFGYFEMDLLAQILYMADYIEPNRMFPEAKKAAQLVNIDLTHAVIYQMSQTLSYRIQNYLTISPVSIKIYNHWASKNIGGTMDKQETLKTVEVVVKAANKLSARDIVVLDARKVTPISDYFIIMSATNERQLNAIVDTIADELVNANIEVKDIEGRGSKWLLIDAYDVIVHVFYQDERNHYNLENMWRDAPMLDLSEWITD